MMESGTVEDKFTKTLHINKFNSIKKNKNSFSDLNSVLKKQMISNKMGLIQHKKDQTRKNT